MLENRAWAAEQLDRDAEYFSRLSHLQTPEFLWIGCSDSRVPANEITNTDPGEIFVHRNIANLVVHTDLNMLSVLQYAVQVLKVRHIIVCGHYGCGGIRAAMTQQSLGLINKWLRIIKDVYYFHKEELQALPQGEQRADRLVDLNVQEQVMNLAKTSIVQMAWKEHNRPTLHGWSTVSPTAFSMIWSRWNQMRRLTPCISMIRMLSDGVGDADYWVLGIYPVPNCQYIKPGTI